MKRKRIEISISHCGWCFCSAQVVGCAWAFINNNSISWGNDMSPLPQVNSGKSTFPFRKIPLQTLLTKVIWFSVIFIAKSISRACGVCFKNVKMHLFANFMHKSIHTKLKCQPRIKLHHLGLKKVNFRNPIFFYEFYLK